MPLAFGAHAGLAPRPDAVSSAAKQLDVSAKPVLMAVAVASAASFLTPITTPANLMVMGPGGYRFGDYWNPRGAAAPPFGPVAVLLLPVIWSFWRAPRADALA